MWNEVMGQKTTEQDKKKDIHTNNKETEAMDLKEWDGSDWREKMKEEK